MELRINISLGIDEATIKIPDFGIDIHLTDNMLTDISFITKEFNDTVLPALEEFKQQIETHCEIQENR